MILTGMCLFGTLAMYTIDTKSMFMSCQVTLSVMQSDPVPQHLYHDNTEAFK